MSPETAQTWMPGMNYMEINALIFGTIFVLFLLALWMWTGSLIEERSKHDQSWPEE